MMRFVLLLALLVYTAGLAAAQSTTEYDVIKPAALKPGDTIALVSPARGTTEERVEFITTRLEKMGYTVKNFGNVTGKWGYLSDKDGARASAVMDAWRDPDVDAIFCTIGGYGTTRFVDLLDYDYIRKNPKIITGFSDITGLHLAIHSQTELVTMHSPTSQYVYGNEPESRPFAAASFWNTLLDEKVRERGSQDPPARIVYTKDDYTSPVVTLSSGTARGPLTGGNLSLIHALMGTPYEIQTDGAIIFIEDVGEEPYRIDRMLCNMRLAGKLDKPAAVVLGIFRGCETDNPERSFLLQDVFEQYFKDVPYPVISGFPLGHVEDNATFPLGVMAELDADAQTLTLLEEAVTPR